MQFQKHISPNTRHLGLFLVTYQGKVPVPRGLPYKDLMNLETVPQNLKIQGNLTKHNVEAQTGRAGNVVIKRRFIMDGSPNLIQ